MINRFLRLVLLWAACLLILAACSAAPNTHTANFTPGATPLLSTLTPDPTAASALPFSTVAPTATPVVPSATPLPSTGREALPSTGREALPSTGREALPPAPEPLTQYTLKASFNYSRHMLQVEQTIDYLNTSGQELNNLLLVVEPNRYPGGFKLNSLKVGDTVLNTFTLENDQLKFSLTAPLPANRRLMVALSFDLNLPVIPAPSNDIRAAIYGFSARQANLIDWYPFIPPFQKGKDWVVHNPWFYGEHQVYEKSNFQVELNLVEPPANLSIAAAAQPDVAGSRYTFSHRNARNFTFSASPMYVVYATTVGKTSVTSYAFTFDAPAGRTALNDAAKALEVYNRLFGAYPHPSLTVVEADFHDGMEYDGLYFLSKGFYNTYDGTPKGYLTLIGVHETAHQWWYARVANDQALEPWLDEAMATYSELLYYANVYPDLVKWWWSYRVDYFKPAGWVNQRIYDYSGSYPYRDGVYLRGAQFLDHIRQRVGDPAFFEFVKDYATRFQDQIVTTQDFFDTLQKHSPADLSDLKKTFFKP